MAALNAAKSARPRLAKASALTNFHTRSMTFRLGEYGGRYNSSMR